MIAQCEEKQHAVEFARQFEELFDKLTNLARSRGIDRYRACGGAPTAEDPDDFAQECLIEYSKRARQLKFLSVQTKLIMRIARDRVIDAWRKQSRMPNRDDFQVSTSRLTEEPGSFGFTCESETIPSIWHLSGKAIEILRLKYVAQLRDREIADAMSMTVDGVRISLKRSRHKLRSDRKANAT